MQAAVTLKLLWPPPLRLEALLAMHVALDTHSVMPHLLAAIHAPEFTAQPAPTPSLPVPAPAANSEATARRCSAGSGGPRAAQGWLPAATAAILGHSAGWARVGLPWWRADGMQVRIALNLGAADDVAQLQRLCAFSRVSGCGARGGGHGGGHGAAPFFVAAAVGGVAVPGDMLRGLVSIEQVRRLHHPRSSLWLQQVFRQVLASPMM